MRRFFCAWTPGDFSTRMDPPKLDLTCGATLSQAPKLARLSTCNGEAMETPMKALMMFSLEMCYAACYAACYALCAS